MYFAKSALGPVKVGTTNNLTRRIFNLRACSLCAVDLLFATPGSWYLERKIKLRLSRHLVHGEWFHHDAQLDALIELLRERGSSALLCASEQYIDTFETSTMACKRLGFTKLMLHDWLTDSAPCPDMVKAA